MQSPQAEIVHSVLEAIPATEAGHEENDEGEDNHHGRYDELHLHVLPPHLAAQQTPCLVEPVSLFKQESNVSVTHQ